MKYLGLLSISRILITAYLLFLLTACGSKNEGIRSPQRAPSASVTTNKPDSTPLAAADVAPPLNKLSPSVDMSGLHIQSDFGIQCPSMLLFGTLPKANLVLATDRLTYSSDELQQMRQYLMNNRYPGGYQGDPDPVPPPTLRWVTGAALQPIPGAEPRGFLCGARLELTNTGNAPIQVPSIGVRLLKDPEQNKYQYRLIDNCTLVSPTSPDGCAPSQGNGPSHCDTYFASIQLGSGKADSVFAATPNGHSYNDQFTPVPCGELTLNPTASATLIIDFTLASETSHNLIYSVVPELTLDISSGRQILAVPQLTSILAFADVSHFSCYGLQGTTFVKEQPVSSEYKSTLWCV
ncbi:MAG: hypothetical protein ACJ788_00585 [Ktedonobacteraceae bacterium]